MKRLTEQMRLTKIKAKYIFNFYKYFNFSF